MISFELELVKHKRQFLTQIESCPNKIARLQESEFGMSLFCYTSSKIRNILVRSGNFFKVFIRCAS